MKKLILILSFLFLSLIVNSRELIVDTINYRAEIITEYTQDNRTVSNKSNVLFEFRSNQILTSLDGQLKSFYLRGWKFDNLFSGQEVMITQAIDNGGFKLAITLGYRELEEDHFIILAYNNLSFLFIVNREEIEKPDDIFIYKIEPPDYTREQIDEFLRQFGNPEVIKTFMIKDLWNNFL